MAGDKNLKLSIWIAGHMDKSLTATINAANGQVSSLSKNISRMGTMGLAAMGALTAGTVAALADCTNAAVKYQNALGNVIKYVDGLADTQGRIGKNAIGKAYNGKTYAENYDAVYNSILNLSTVVPMAKEDLSELTALIGQSGKKLERMFTFDGKGNLTGGLVKDAAVMAAAWDIGAKEAADYSAKWENSFNMTHEQVMELANQINYLGANSATTAAEIANAVNQAASLGQLAGFAPSTVAAMADAMLATGVSTDRVGTSIKRMALNLSKGSDMTKKQKAVLAEMGLTAQQVAKGLNSDNIGMMNRLFEGIAKLPEHRRLNAVGQLFGIWAAEGGAKIVNNLDVYQKALTMVGETEKYMTSMQREFDIKSATPEAVRQMRNNAIDMFKINIGKSFLPVRAQMDEAVRKLFIDLNGNMPQFTALAESAAKLLSNGITATGEALKNAMPYIQQALDYLINNGDKAIKAVEGLAAAFIGMKFMPQIEGFFSGAAALLTGRGGMNSLLAGGPGQERGRKPGGLLGGGKDLFTGGQNAAAAEVGTISAFRGAAGSNGLVNTVGAAVSSLIAGNGISGTTGLLQVAARSPNMLSNYQSVEDALLNTRAGQYFGKIGSALGNFFGTGIGGGLFKGAKGTFGVAGEILKGISDDTGLTGLLLGIGNLGKGAAGWIGGKAAGISAAIAKSRPVRAVGAVAASAPAQAIKGMLQYTGGGLMNTAGAGIGVLSSIWGPIAGGFGSLLAGAAPVVVAISGIIAVVSILGDHLEDIRGIVGNIFGKKGLDVFDKFTKKLGVVGKFISGLFLDGGVAKALTPLREGFAGLLGKDGLISTIFGGQENGLAAFDGLVQIIQSIMGVVGQLVTFAESRVKPIILKIFDIVTKTVLPSIVSMFAQSAPTIAAIISNLGSAVMTVMQFIGSVILEVMPTVEAITRIILNIANVVIPAVIAAFGRFALGIKNAVDGARETLTGIIVFIKGVFAKDWDLAWIGIRQSFGGIFKTLGELFKTPINAVIALINKAVESINSLGLTIPSWVPDIGGQTFSMNIPQIPMLARGGFTDGPSIAGEAGREAVISFKASERARNISLWEQAGRMLGMNRAVELDKIGGKEPERGRESFGAGFTFAPQITIEGNADDAVIDRAIEKMRCEFEAWYEEMQRRRARTAY